MNPEIYSIIEDMKKQIPKNNVSMDARVYQNYLSVQMARLFVLLAEESEKQSQILIKQTEQLIRFTRFLLLFTIVIAFLSVVLILQAFKILP